MKTQAKAKWGDAEDDETAELNVPHEETSYLEDGSKLKTITRYVLNEKGQRVKLVKKIKLFKQKVKINKRVEERKKWRKFGECQGAGPGPEPGITSIGDELFLELTTRKEPTAAEKPAAPAKSMEVAISSIVCRNCGRTGHWTMKCPFGKVDRTEVPESLRSPSEAPLGEPGKGSYRPPHMRGLGRGGSSMDEGPSSPGRPGRDDTATIRVTNLSEDVRDQDLHDLFQPFGKVQRIFLAKDKTSQLSKGFAFVNFVSHRDAQRAIDALDGKGYNHLILRVEWAKPSNK